MMENTKEVAKSVQETIKETIPSKKPLSYAERVGVKAKNVAEASIKEPRNLVTIFPGRNECLKTSDDVKEALKKLVTPSEEGIGIRNVRKISNNGVLIETQKKRDIDIILKNEKIKAAGMEVGLPAKKSPKIIIFSVPRPSNDEETRMEIMRHNFEGEELKTLTKHSKVAFKTGDKNKENCDLVLEVTKEARDILRKREGLYVGWACCKFQDYIVPTRCYKCQGYGHITKHCKAEKETCGHCGADGHSHKECKAKEKPATCINCRRTGKPAGHSVKDKQCFAYKAATQALIDKTDYDQ